MCGIKMRGSLSARFVCWIFAGSGESVCSIQQRRGDKKLKVFGNAPQVLAEIFMGFGVMDF